MTEKPYTYTPKSNKVSRFARIRALINRHRIMTMLICAALLIFIGGGIAFMLAYQPPKGYTWLPIPKKPEPVVYYSPLTGVEVKNEATTKRPVTGVMIENSPAARPQSGLKQAGIVYEAIAEGGITRFMALYQEDQPGLIGPVRSVREYDLDWLYPYHAGLAHVGGSARALSIIRSGGGWRDLDQFFNAGSYWRTTDRYAPHNVYTNFSRLNALNRAKGYTTSEFTGFARQDGKPAEKPTASDVHINFSSATYNTRYTYDAKTNSYTRHQAGAVHADREKGAIRPSVVIAMHVDMRTVMEDGYRQRITTTGSGKATMFQNGTAKNVTWHKSSQKAPLYFKDKDGKDVELVRGQTWIAAVPNGQGSVSWK